MLTPVYIITVCIEHLNVVTISNMIDYILHYLKETTRYCPLWDVPAHWANISSILTTLTQSLFLDTIIPIFITTPKKQRIMDKRWLTKRRCENKNILVRQNQQYYHKNNIYSLVPRMQQWRLNHRLGWLVTDLMWL